MAVSSGIQSPVRQLFTIPSGTTFSAASVGVGVGEFVGVGVEVGAIVGVGVEVGVELGVEVSVIRLLPLLTS